ncbi:MAG TPA: hypothetical protein V6D00_07775 [Pantanalinema sp.]
MFACILMLIACGQQGSLPPPDAGARDEGRLLYRSDWAKLPAGTEPAEWRDVRFDGFDFPWLYGGGWCLARMGAQAIYQVPDALSEPSEPLTFRRYQGALSARYRVRLEGRSQGGAARFGGYGELAAQVYYLSPTSYVEVLQTDRHLMLWQAVDAPPMQGKGWTLLAQVDNPVRIGEWVRFGAEVDTRTGQVTAYLGDRPVATASAPLVSRDRPGGLTLRATGNREDWRTVEIRALP